ncbi:sigma-70 family RNA polymerase sigma factor [Nocardioides sp.]|uniref:sigma-70 family RNA polymerase sigma factor n=1 Tax=Nocardioides sp. TaxID=35761 RepID=UPI00260CF64D|nr:sigma-70 family RNA polymerase sigma factor [Nocardioides sp.]
MAALLAERDGLDDADRRDALTTEIILLNRGVAESVAGRFTGRGIGSEDLRQVAYEALIKAVHRFDASRDRDLLSFAIPTIRGEIRRYFRDHGWMVRPPRRLQELQQRIGHSRQDLAHQLGREPTTEELAAVMGISATECLQAMQAYGCFQVPSLDQPLEPGGHGSIADTVIAEDRSTEVADTMLTLGPVVRTLPDRDRRILYLRFYEERTQAEIGRELGVTQMQVSRLLSGIFTKVREQLGDVPVR